MFWFEDIQKDKNKILFKFCYTESHINLQKTLKIQKLKQFQIFNLQINLLTFLPEGYITIQILTIQTLINIF